MNICSNKLCFLATDVTLNLTSCALWHFRFMLIRHLIKTGAGIGLPLKS
ncbi:transcriptional regulator, partial [Escherichia coli]|nr:transcriptional regulator [Escherichia coli]